MQPERIVYRILPVEVEEDKEIETITIMVSAITTCDDYRCRELDEVYYTVLDSTERTIYSNSYENNKVLSSSIIPERIGEKIVSDYFRVECDDGKYPDVFITLPDDFYSISFEEKDTLGNKGYFTGTYELRIVKDPGIFLMV